MLLSIVLFEISIRRGEISDTTGLGVEGLLEKALSENDPHALMNLALEKSTNKGDWDDGDAIVAGLSAEGVKAITPWWEELYDKGDPEGLLVLLWLERHGHGAGNLRKNAVKHYNKLRKRYKDIPRWIIERYI